MSAHSHLKIRGLKKCPVWEVVDPAGVFVRSSPTVGADNRIDTIAAGTLVERLDNIDYVDTLPGSGVTFYKVGVSYNPVITGFVAAQIANLSTGQIDYILLQTVNALTACKILGTEELCCT
jgi:hypothetical protein